MDLPGRMLIALDSTGGSQAFTGHQLAKISINPHDFVDVSLYDISRLIGHYSIYI